MEFEVYLFLAIVSSASSISCYFIAKKRNGIAEVYGVMGMLLGPFAIPFAFFARKSKRNLDAIDKLQGKKGWLILLLIDMAIILIFELAAIGIALYVLNILIQTSDYDILFLKSSITALTTSIFSIVCFAIFIKSIIKNETISRYLIPLIYVIALFSAFLNYSLSPTELDKSALSGYKLYLATLSLRFMIWFPYSICSRRVSINFYPKGKKSS